jgi:phenylacetate-coenzyme A ligase PaaK-like adenylate-forming protein
MGYRIGRLQDFARGVRETKVLLERERWPRERIERHQAARLAELTEFAAAHSPLWRERLPHGDFELEDLPVLTKAELMEDFDGLVTDRRRGPRARRNGSAPASARVSRSSACRGRR